MPPLFVVMRDAENLRLWRKQWRQKHKAKISQQTKERRKANLMHFTKIVRKAALKRLYNITPEQYETRLLKQKYCCAICNIHQSKLKRRLAVDHCHKSGRVRGLLCYKCNEGLGFFTDSVTVLQKAINYLDSYD